MVFETVMAGFGGQGIMYMGDILAQAAVREGHRTTFLPTYGAAMRGGVADCVVIISNEKIGSPLLDSPDAGVFMNQASLVKFQPMIRDGGVIVVNTSIADPASIAVPDTVRAVCIPATDLAVKAVGTDKVANIIALGALLKHEPVVKIETLEYIFNDNGDLREKDIVQKNVAALWHGYGYV